MAYLASPAKTEPYSDSTATCTLLELDEDLLLCVVRLLPAASVAKLALCCSALFAVCMDPELWRALIDRDFARYAASFPPVPPRPGRASGEAGDSEGPGGRHVAGADTRALVQHHRKCAALRGLRKVSWDQRGRQAHTPVGPREGHAAAAIRHPSLPACQHLIVVGGFGRGISLDVNVMALTGPMRGRWRRSEDDGGLHRPGWNSEEVNWWGDPSQHDRLIVGDMLGRGRYGHTVTSLAEDGSRLLVFGGMTRGGYGGESDKAALLHAVYPAQGPLDQWDFSSPPAPAPAAGRASGAGAEPARAPPGVHPPEALDSDAEEAGPEEEAARVTGRSIDLPRALRHRPPDAPPQAAGGMSNMIAEGEQGEPQEEEEEEEVGREGQWEEEETEGQEEEEAEDEEEVGREGQREEEETEGQQEEEAAAEGSPFVDWLDDAFFYDASEGRESGSEDGEEAGAESGDDDDDSDGAEEPTTPDTDDTVMYDDDSDDDDEDEEDDEGSAGEDLSSADLAGLLPPQLRGAFRWSSYMNEVGVHILRRVREQLAPRGGRAGAAGEPEPPIPSSAQHWPTFYWQALPAPAGPAPDARPVRPGARGYHTATFSVADQRVYVFGGLQHHEPIADLLVLDTKTWHWTRPATTGAPPCARFGHTATVVGRRLVVVGGAVEGSDLLRDGRDLVGSVHALDLDSLEWTEPDLDFSGLEHPTAIATGRCHAAVAVGRKILLFGGASVAALGQQTRHVTILDTDTWQFYTPQVSNHWGSSRLGSGAALGFGGAYPEARLSHQMVLAGGDRAAVVGGWANGRGPLSDAVFMNLA